MFKNQFEIWKFFRPGTERTVQDFLDLLARTGPKFLKFCSSGSGSRFEPSNSCQKDSTLFLAEKCQFVAGLLKSQKFHHGPILAPIRIWILIISRLNEIYMELEHGVLRFDILRHTHSVSDQPFRRKIFDQLQAILIGSRISIYD